MADKMITTSNRDLAPLRKGFVKEKLLPDGTVVLVSTNPLKTIQTGDPRARPKAKLEGEEVVNYYPPLTTTLKNRFADNAKGRKALERYMETEANKKRVAAGVPPVIKKGKTENKK